MENKLYLFDIDGTLIHAGKTPSRVFAESIETVTGTPVVFPGGIFLGRTDTFIIREMLRLIDLPPADGYYDRIKKQFIQRMKDEFPVSADGFVIPGALEFVQQISADPRINIGLVTGNFYATAYIKLDKFGLASYFPSGGFGEDGEERIELVFRAVERVSMLYKKDFLPENITVFGDTSRDIESARYYGYRSVGVSHVRDKTDLAAAKPDKLIDNFFELMKGNGTL